MPRTTIAAVLAMLLLLAPAASARPLDAGYPAYPTPEVTPQPEVMPERITDHPAPKADVGSLVLEEESTSGSGNQGVARPAEPAPAPATTGDDTPWPLIGAGIVVLLGVAALLVARQRRPRVAT
jgi:MYXO-CTERM domain-containing protein